MAPPIGRLRARALEVAPRTPGYAHALVALGRDRHYGGGLLAGALAFRLFGALLPLALLVAVALGYAATIERTAPDTIGSATGISQALLASVAESSKLSAGTRWLVATTTLVALLWTATSAARAIRAVHSIAWMGRVERLGRPLHAGLLLLATLAAFALVFAVAGRARAELGGAGLVLSAVAGIAFFAIWLGVASLLPHGRAPMSALIPGAVVFATGVQLVHLATVVFVAASVDRASATYGSLGVAFTLLVWLYVASRVIVASAMLNAALWEQAAAGRPRPRGT